MMAIYNAKELLRGRFKNASSNLFYEVIVLWCIASLQIPEHVIGNDFWIKSVAHNKGPHDSILQSMVHIIMNFAKLWQMLTIENFTYETNFPKIQHTRPNMEALLWDVRYEFVGQALDIMSKSTIVTHTKLWWVLPVTTSHR